MKISSAVVFSLLLLLPLAEAAHAGANLAVEVERPAQLLTESDSSFGATVRDRRQESGRILRCWQHGRLLYEGGGFNQPMPPPSALTINRKDGEVTTVFNLQDGLCILSDR
ncbi:MAG: hypothetical protein LBS89_02230 [Zoogloeaceae bacterium]|jgi:hypothetical protein|nr:hypothetical protein [Zoogloeaceae bacterium]